MKLIKSVTLDTGVNSQKISDVFSADYKLYKIMLSGIVGNESTATAVNTRLVKASDDSTEDDTIYEYAVFNLKSEASFNDSQDLDDTRWFNTFGGIDDNAQAGGGVLYLSNPFGADYTFGVFESVNHTNGPNFRSYWGTVCIRDTVSYDGITIDLNESAARIGGGVVSIYGII